MIVCLNHGYAFIHIPRTGGISITTALAHACGGHACIDAFSRRHAVAGGIAYELPCWSQLYRFAVIRSPWDVIASDWRLVHHSLKTYHREAIQWPGWSQRLERVRPMSFDEFVRVEWLGEWPLDGGLWRTWCTGNGRDLGVQPILFSELRDRWRELCRRIGVMTLPLPRENGVTSGPPANWTRDLSEAVGYKFREDVERFGFEPPATVSRPITQGGDHEPGMACTK